MQYFSGKKKWGFNNVHSDRTSHLKQDCSFFKRHHGPLSKDKLRKVHFLSRFKKTVPSTPHVHKIKHNYIRMAQRRWCVIKMSEFNTAYK